MDEQKVFVVGGRDYTFEQIMDIAYHFNIDLQALFDTNLDTVDTIQTGKRSDRRYWEWLEVLQLRDRDQVYEAYQRWMEAKKIYELRLSFPPDKLRTFSVFSKKFLVSMDDLPEVVDALPTSASNDISVRRSIEYYANRDMQIVDRNEACRLFKEGRGVYAVVRWSKTESSTIADGYVLVPFHIERNAQEAKI